MNCDIARDIMSLYIDEELDENTKTQFEEHLKTCIICREDLDILICAVDVMSDMTVELPDGFNERLHDKLTNIKQEKKAFIKPLYLKTLSAVAAALVIVFIARGVFYDPAGQNMATSSVMNDGAADTLKSAENFGIMAAKEETVHEAAPTLATRGFSAMAGMTEAENEVRYALDIEEDITDTDKIYGVFEEYSITVTMEQAENDDIKLFINVTETVFNEIFPQLESRFSDMGLLFEYEEPDFNDSDSTIKASLKKPE